ncbi:unnamed protein product [Tilletia controversa]|uniref:WD40 repeat-like protein n=3 Tax=Tilletia TaxID=13289 RepID=A0A8X7MU17_9BASI|nr:hypothetical protein CF336_g5660 [Tilletia laevis]KAE8198799.1 hypothetical protein CF328_g3438 [Tilletia controversa]KAE8260978.1 hypothetical protein A4X03_0g3647 [Tilletia caries]KAE8201659.1 hypothetical protein CF335_g3697 [Tilletia laevis]KAE8247846.1 hypothetical protein A4X06_0g4142 [Tilletia controversa]
MKHFSVQAELPVYALDFLSEDVIVYAGGGGAGRSGVKNAIRTVRVDLPGQTVKELNRLELSRDEDAPMCLSVNKSLGNLVCGINSTADKVKEGKNESLRVFEYELKEAEKKGEKEEEEKSEELSATVTFTKSATSLPITDPEQYQKFSTFSPDERLLVTGGTDGSFTLHTYPSLKPAWQSPPDAFGSDSATEELYSGDFSYDSEQLVLASAQKIKVFSTSPAPPSAPAGAAAATASTAEGSSSLTAGDATEKVKRPLKIQTIRNPALGGAGPCTFRAARFGRAPTSEKVLFTVVNAGSAGKGAKGKRKSFVSAWNAETWDLIQTRHVADKPITAFDVSADGRLLAYGCSDLSVGVLDAKTLRPILRILDAHSFPPTCLRLSPSGRTLISGSADNTLRVVEIPPSALLGSSAASTRSVLLTVLLALIFVIIAYILQQRLALMQS